MLNRLQRRCHMKQTKYNLMEELKKINKVIQKLLPDGPHELLMIIDATTGQNALLQARKFAEDVGLTGVVITKLDSTGIRLSMPSSMARVIFSPAAEPMLPPMKRKSMMASASGNSTMVAWPITTASFMPTFFRSSSSFLL